MPHSSKLIVCLASSRKLAGRCVAGREWTDAGTPGEWIRPISDRENGEVSARERQYQGGAEPRVLDVINIPTLKRLPQGFQTENWLLDPNYYWQKYGTFPLSGLARIVDSPARPLWINGHSTLHGTNDRVSEEDTSSLPNSLSLIRVDQLMLSVFAPGEAFGDFTRRVQGMFLIWVCRMLCV